ncbi:hypothetical protein F3J20_22625 [Paraburkholderia sp. Cy-641]|uniref:hypothetical protein n=1 Tax=Paraburkholderia sp. Cy-641 TaxID=2608337 RepID=UPI00141F365A|nr:hypothetical protein [Paraburkholderia sp. Cy-641]NIF80153.1 hypothetical protein [Paraburkholderia sp. Cy-641]
MSHFEHGMTCCNRHRVHIGLECAVNQQLACAATALKWQAEYSPAALPKFMRSVLAAFPDHLSYLRVAAREAEALDEFIRQGALVCASLPTKTDRQAWRAAFLGAYDSCAYETHLTSGLCATHVEAFDKAMSAEWHRLRGRIPGSTK